MRERLIDPWQPAAQVFEALADLARLDSGLGQLAQRLYR